MKKLLVIYRHKILCLCLLSLIPALITAQTFAGYTFDSLSTGMTSPGAYVLSLAMKDSTITSHLYAGGHFKIAGRQPAVNIAEWFDTVNYNPVYGKWEPLGTGVDSDVCAVAMYGNKLYAGGKFDTAGGITSSHIACWDTASLTWDSLVGKLNGNVYALCVYNNALYVGGDFTIANGDTVNRIAKWNDTAWSAVGKGFDSGTVYALTVCNDTLFAGGSFLKSNGRAVNHVALFNGSFWDSLGSGTNNTVYALSPYYNYQLIIGGAFTKSGNIRTNFISSYTQFNNSWDSLGSGTNDTVRALNAGWGAIASIIKKQTEQGIGGGNILVIGGNFDSVGGNHSHYIAGYGGFGGGWDTVGELNGPVFALANPFDAYDGSNYVGGDFSVAMNGFTSTIDTVNNIAYLSVFLGGGIPTINNTSIITVSPNPSSGKFIFQLSGVSSQMLSHAELVSASQSITIYNVLGEPVYAATLKQSRWLSGQGDPTIDLSNQPNGVYFYRVVAQNGELIEEGKLIVQK